jgi:hypothetical protein
MALEDGTHAFGLRVMVRRRDSITSARHGRSSGSLAHCSTVGESATSPTAPTAFIPDGQAHAGERPFPLRHRKPICPLAARACPNCPTDWRWLRITSASRILPTISSGV